MPAAEELAAEPEPPLSQELRAWLESPGSKRLGDVVELFGPKSFAVLFVLLHGVPALPLPTGGVTHVFEVIAVLLAAQLVVGREEVWLPERFRARELEGEQRFITGLTKLIARFERLSKRRLAFLFGSRPSNAVFGLIVIAGSVAAFLAPPFTGLDTLPALGVVLVSLAVLVEDIAFVVVGLVLLAAGILLEVVLGKAAVDAISDLF